MIMVLVEVFETVEYSSLKEQRTRKCEKLSILFSVVVHEHCVAEASISFFPAGHMSST